MNKQLKDKLKHIMEWKIKLSSPSHAGLAMKNWMKSIWKKNQMRLDNIYYENCMIAEWILKSKSVISFKENEEEVNNMRKLIKKTPKKNVVDDTLKILR
mgnify:CR=1 FL=1